MRGVADQWVQDIIRALYQQRTATRSEIIGITRLSASSVSQALRMLLARGTVLKVGELESGGGRRREVLTLNHDAAYFIGVDLVSHRIRFALVSFGGDVRYRWEEGFPANRSLDVHRIFDGIERAASTLTAHQLGRLTGVGISYPGLLDREGRLTAVNLGWRRVRVLAELEEAARDRGFENLPIFLEPDRHSSLLAEQLLGRAQHRRNWAYVTADRGIGVGIFVDGTVVQGCRDMAGELGHLTIEPAASDRCNCGKKGCLEAIATGENIARQYVEGVGSKQSRRGVRFTDVLEAARNENPLALAVIDRAGRAWGLALSHLVSLFNPELIVLGGDLVTGSDLFIPLIRKELARHCFPELVGCLEIVTSSLGLDTRVIAAASLAFRKCLADPALLQRMCSPVL